MDQIDEIREVFESILCMAAEGPCAIGRGRALAAVARDAGKGLAICRGRDARASREKNFRQVMAGLETIRALSLEMAEGMKQGRWMDVRACEDAIHAQSCYLRRGVWLAEMAAMEGDPEDKG